MRWWRTAFPWSFPFFGKRMRTSGLKSETKRVHLVPDAVEQKRTETHRSRVDPFCAEAWREEKAEPIVASLSYGTAGGTESSTQISFTKRRRREESQGEESRDSAFARRSTFPFVSCLLGKAHPSGDGHSDGEKGWTNMRATCSFPYVRIAAWCSFDSRRSTYTFVLNALAPASPCTPFSRSASSFVHFRREARQSPPSSRGGRAQGGIVHDSVFLSKTLVGSAVGQKKEVDK